jgi:hypothetical protein
MHYAIGSALSLACGKSFKKLEKVYENVNDENRYTRSRQT